MNQGPPSLSGFNPEQVEAVRAAESKAKALREQRQSLEADFLKLRRLAREHALAAQRAQALEADLRDVREEREREGLAWRQKHPLREAANALLGESEVLRAHRAERDRLLNEENALRHEGQAHAQATRRLVEQELGLWKVLHQARQQEGEAWQQVESLLRPSSPALARPRIERSR